MDMMSMSYRYLTQGIGSAFLSAVKVQLQTPAARDQALKAAFPMWQIHLNDGG